MPNVNKFGVNDCQSVSLVFSQSRQVFSEFFWVHSFDQFVSPKPTNNVFLVLGFNGVRDNIQIRRNVAGLLPNVVQIVKKFYFKPLKVLFGKRLKIGLSKGDIHEIFTDSLVLEFDHICPIAVFLGSPVVNVHNFKIVLWVDSRQPNNLNFGNHKRIIVVEAEIVLF